MNNIVRLLCLALALAARHAPLLAQGAAMPVPWAVGERLDYDVKFGPMHVGNGSMEVLGNDNVRNRPTWHIMFRVKGGTFFYHVDDKFESWIETTTGSSLRHKQDMNEGRRDRERTFEIFPERPSYIEDDKPEKPSVENPLDDGSFLYFIRTVPLEVGKTYEFNRYYHVDRNPVVIQVVRKEHIKVPAGEFDAIVVKPIIKSKGLFSENGQAEVWFSDDSTRTLLRLKSKLPFGTLYLELKDREAGSP